MSKAQLAFIKLDEAYRYLLERKFDKAMASALEGLDSISGSQDTDKRLQILSLLANIHNTQGRYQYDTSHYRKSISYLKQAIILSSTSLIDEVVWNFHIQLAQTYLLLKDFSEAYDLLCECMSDQAILDKYPNNKIVILLAFSEYYYLKNEFDEASEYLQLAFREIDGNESTELQLDIYEQATKIHLKKQEYPKIFEYGTKIINLATEAKDLEREFVGLNATAIYSASQQDFKTAMLHFKNALDKSIEINYRYGIAFSLINIGTIYANLFNYNEALGRYIKVLDNYGDILDDSHQLIIMNNIGNIYYAVGDAQEALEYFQRSVVLANDMGYTEMESHELAQMSRALVALKRYDEALEYGNAALDLMNSTESSEGQHIIYITLGNIYYELDNFDEAIRYVGRGIVSAKQVQDITSEIRGYRLMSNIYQKKGDYKKALNYQIFFSQTQEKYTLEQINRQKVDLEIKYDLQEKEKEFTLLKTYQDKLVSQHEQIKEQNEKLIEANQNLTQFAYAVSHDLKEPLRMIGSYTNLIQNRYKVQIEKESASLEFFNYITLGVDRMGRLLDDLLKYATVGNEDDLDLEHVDLAEIFEFTTINLKIAIQEASATVQSNELPVILTNRSYISQLFQNLIANAVKFKKIGRKPIVDITYQKVGEFHHISFKDNGIGIPNDDLNRIFQAFQRVHKKQGYKGTGIGLAICIKIAKRLGGEIKVQSKEGVGSEFIIILPEGEPRATKVADNNE